MKKWLFRKNTHRNCWINKNTLDKKDETLQNQDAQLKTQDEKLLEQEQQLSTRCQTERAGIYTECTAVGIGPKKTAQLKRSAGADRPDHRCEGRRN